MKYRELLNIGSNKLKEAQIVDFSNDGWLLMEHIFGINRSSYFMKMEDTILDQLKIEKFLQAIEKRSTHYPLQYIIGKWIFMGMEFLVNKDVLIPRQDTECLVEKTIDIIKTTYENKKIKVLDMCTGSGCIGISICKSCENTEVTCVDLSKEALKIAKENAKNILNQSQNERLKIIQSDLFENVNDEFDVIVSNPPYIKTKDIDELMEEVKLYEPKQALDGHSDGLFFYEKITREAIKYLTPQSFILYEIGCSQGKEVMDILNKNKFENIELVKDLAGLDRIVVGKKIKIIIN